MTITKTKTDYLLVFISYLGFIALALPAGLRQAAWSPYIQETFNQSFDAIGWVLVATTIGYFITSFVCGQLIARFGIDKLLVFSCVVMALGLFGFFIAPVWEMMIVTALVYGLGSGALDTGLNIYFAANYSARLMNWLHACFGIGLSLGPLLLQWLVALGLSQEQAWRWGFALCAILLVSLCAAILFTLKRWYIQQSPIPVEGETAKLSMAGAMRLPIVWFSIGMFLVYAGFEGTPGEWLDDLFYRARGVELRQAAIWITYYWGSFSIGRFLFGLIVDRIPSITLLRGCMILLVASAFFLWLNLGSAINLISVLALGFSQAPIFALLTSETPRRVGPENAANAISFQVAAASIGFAIFPALAGVLADDYGIESLTPMLLVGTVLIFLIHEAVIYLSPKRKPVAA